MFRYGPNKDKWYSFNDAEVKPFDPNQIASECFGGEMSSRTYDQVTDKFMDLSIEKTNSAYMLFYERIERSDHPEAETEAGPSELKPSPIKASSTVTATSISAVSAASAASTAAPSFGLSQVRGQTVIFYIFKHSWNCLGSRSEHDLLR